MASLQWKINNAQHGTFSVYFCFLCLPLLLFYNLCSFHFIILLEFRWTQPKKLANFSCKRYNSFHIAHIRSPIWGVFESNYWNEKKTLPKALRKLTSIYLRQRNFRHKQRLLISVTDIVLMKMFASLYENENFSLGKEQEWSWRRYTFVGDNMWMSSVSPFLWCFMHKIKRFLALLLWKLIFAELIIMEMKNICMRGKFYLFEQIMMRNALVHRLFLSSLPAFKY